MLLGVVAMAQENSSENRTIINSDYIIVNDNGILRKHYGSEITMERMGQAVMFEIKDVEIGPRVEVIGKQPLPNQPLERSATCMSSIAGHGAICGPEETVFSGGVEYRVCMRSNNIVCVLYAL